MTMFVHPHSDGHFELIDGEFLALYPNIDASELIELNEASYQEYLNRSNHLTRFSDGHFVYADITIDHKAELATAKVAKLRTLATQSQQFIDAQTQPTPVPDFELKTWVVQGQEAKAWAADPQTPTPVLDQIAAARGIDPTILKTAALRKTLAYEALTAHIAGQRQALQTAIEKAKDMATLEAIKIVFTLPTNQ